MKNEHTLSENELALLCEQVQVLSLRIGKFIREERKKVKASDIETKSFNNLVSYVDKNAEAQFVSELKTIFPEAGFIAEENAALIRNARYNWIIDPLDGTTNFLRGVPCFATSVALTDGAEILLGVVYEINQDECFYAWKNGGAWLNGERIAVSEKTSCRESLIGTGFPYYDMELQKNYLNLFEELQQEALGIRRIGSAATDIAYVACGRFDAFFEYGLHAWDIAAGSLLVKEAGGSVSSFSGESDFLFGKTYCCGNKHVHADLLSKIKNYF